MKKYIFNIMALVLATIVSCQNNDVVNNNSSDKVTISATISNEGQTRVALTPETQDGNPMVKAEWENNGESFKLYGLLQGGGFSDPQIFTQISEDQFSGTLPETEYSDSYRAVYPATEDFTAADDGMSQVSYNPNVYTSQNGKLSSERTAMCGYNENMHHGGPVIIKFDHITTLLMPRFRIRGESQNLTADKINTIVFKDMPVVTGQEVDFNIDCTSHNAEDDIYVYLPDAGYKKYGYFEGNEGFKNTIEILVYTNDAKTYQGTLTFSQDGESVFISTGKLYTANIWLDPKVEANVITYTTTDNQQLELSDSYWGAGDARIYSSHTFSNGIGKITLKDGVTAIPDGGFYTRYNLKAIELPSAITTIGNNVFASCIKLESINLKNITTIGYNSFSQCLALSTIDLSSATYIGRYAFISCHNLKIVIINNSTLPSFGEYNPFYACNALESIYVPDSKVEEYKSIPVLTDVKEKIKPISNESE